MFQYSLLLILSVLLFLYGFFPITNTTAKFKNDPPTQIGNLTINPAESYRPHLTRTVLFVIDALRWDFVTQELMPLTVKLMNRKGCLSKVHVESPTVTLPRIKALTTGSVPQYLDIVRNMASSEILSDSWLHSAKKKGMKTVFYGDNTWEKLFPDFFTRSEGTTSFFVWDFHEVDDNVTRNVNLELEREDWDIMILHYLGLDHIGHVYGPFSARMPLKLKEMDEVINKIYQNTNSSNTLILVTADHGMRDSGGHGGTTHAEVTVPLIAIGLNCQNSSFLQTDIPANLAVLLGLDIPSTSIGKIQKFLLNSLNLQEYLYALRYNAELLLKKNDLCIDTFLNATYFHEKFLTSKNEKYANITMNLYQNCSEKITKKLYEASSKQDMSSLYVAISVMLNILSMLLRRMLSTDHHNVHNAEVCLCIFIVCVQFIVSFDAISKVFILILLGLFTVQLRKVIECIKVSIFYNTLNAFLVLTCVLHPVTFISTSLVEEEHYYWIHLSVTLILLLITNACNQRKSFLPGNVAQMFLVLICIRFSMDLNSTIENSIEDPDNLAHILGAEKNHLYHQFFFSFSLILVFFAMYSNQKTSEDAYIPKILCLATLLSIFLLKSTTYHNAFLGKWVWILIILQKTLFKHYSWKYLWIHAASLLSKPHNVILIPLAVYTSNQICKLDKFKNIPALTVASYMLSNCFYFIQGHRNSLSSVDVSAGFTGLNDYYPVLVISQALINVYTFPVLFNLTVLPSIAEIKEENKFWVTLLALRTSVVMFSCVMMIIFRHHLFIWSVFAPKLFIESVHTAFLFTEICFWYVSCYVKRLFCFYLNR